MDAKEMMRAAEVHALDLVGQEMPDALQRLLQVAVSVTGAEGAALNVVTSTSQYTLASTIGRTGRSDAADSFCARILGEPARQHLVPDARLDERYADNVLVSTGRVVTYAASQLRTSDDVAIGTLCVFDSQRREISEQAMRVLSELSTAAMDILESRRQQRQMQESLIQLSDGQRELRRSNEHLAAFAGQVSHDVRGPLAGLLMALQLMEEDIDDEEREMLLRSALSGAQRMRATIAGLMDFAVLGGSLVHESLDMNGVVAEVLADLSAHIGRAEVVVGNLPKVWADDVQIRAVTQNLLANALKYAGGTDRPTIRVDGELRGARTRITVSDNGPGVPGEQRAMIFESMVRGADTEHSGIEGLGIGLATCRRIMNAHLGEIGVEDSVTGGASFWFELPVRPEVRV